MQLLHGAVVIFAYVREGAVISENVMYVIRGIGCMFIVFGTLMCVAHLHFFFSFVLPPRHFALLAVSPDA